MRDDVNIGVDERELDDAALEALAAAHATAPPARLRARLLGQVRADAERVAGAQRALARWRVATALAATVALVLGWQLVRQMDRAGRQFDELQALARGSAEMTARLTEQERTLAGLRESLAAQAQVLRVLAGPRTVTAALAPTPDGGQATGRVVVDPGSGETAVVLAGLKPPPPGHVYELWAIRGERPPEPAGLLPGGGGAVSGARVEHPDEVTAFAVSLEPAGGSKTPTGPIVLVGPVAS